MTSSDFVDGLELPDDGVLAAEYVLRLADAEAMLVARGREATDEEFAREVAGWNVRLSPLFDEIASVQPREALWDRIVAAIRPAVAGGDVEAAASVVPIARRRLTPITGLLALAASVLLAFGAWTLRPRTTPAVPAASAPAGTLIASLAPEGAAALASARYDVAGRMLSLTPAALAVPAGRSLELWVVPADGRPRSLGVIAPRAPLSIAFADDLARLFARGATIAISIEAEGGSRTGSPGGPILASGTLRQA